MFPRIALITVFTLAGGAYAQTAGHPFEFKLLERPAKISYSRKGLEIESGDGNYAVNIRGRMQLRLWRPFDENPWKAADLTAKPKTVFKFRRARFKLEAHAFRPWFTINFEEDLLGTGIVSLYATVEKLEWLQFRAGQFKPDFSRERSTSSAKQQFADRSIVNQVLTVDRQRGFTVFGHVLPETRGDSWYYLGVVSGNGKNEWFSSGEPMLVGRYQWNFLGRDLGFSSSDLEYHDAASVALAGARNRSRYTRFSSDGGGQLEGFDPGALRQYSLKQWTGDVFLKYRGFSLQHECHWKNVYDHVNARSTDMAGAYAQTGYFPHYLATVVPKALDVGYRYGFVDLRRRQPRDLAEEHSFVANWFFEGHDNKLVFEAARLSMEKNAGPAVTAWRYRLHWEVHF